jgi:DNA (cytosine-5)-methyltransferase 1
VERQVVRKPVELDTPCPAVLTHGRLHTHSELSLPIAPPIAPAPAAPPGRPPYRVPTMAEIAAVPWNGLSVVSTFSGCGGSSLGYRMAGYRVRLASEFVPAARDTYRANFPDTPIDPRDIRVVQPADVLAAIGMAAGELDLLDGSPPCASFSTAGKGHAAWGQVKPYSDTKQRTDDLFFEFARILRGVQPKTFVAENVSGLVKGAAKGYFLDILAELKACGYTVQCRLLDAQWLGVPQMRPRVIFIGVRTDLRLAPAHPKPLPYRYSVRDALPGITGDLEHANGFTGHRPRSTAGPAAAIQANRPIAVIEPETDIGPYAIGAEWDRTPAGGASKKYFSLKRPALDRPSHAVTQTGGAPSAASVCHPTERRKFSIAELKRICAFPDDFILTGTYAQQWERLGRAVPPVMMAAIASTVRDEILLRLE